MKSITRCVRSLHCVCLGIALLLGLTLTAQAHDPSLSTATVTVGDQQIDVLLGFARQDATFILSANANPADIGAPEKHCDPSSNPLLRAGSISILGNNEPYQFKRRRNLGTARMS